MNNLIILKAKIAFAVLAFFISAYFTFDHFRVENKNESKERIPYALKPDDKVLLESGDIIMRKGTGYVSNVINEMFNSGFQLSHCGMVLRENDSLFVVHTVSSELSNVDGVQAEPLDKFVSESVRNSIVVVRYKASDSIRTELAKAAKAYQYRHKEFDHRFDLADTTEFYCTELIHYSFMDVYHKDMFPERYQTDHPDFLSLNAFLDSTKFDIIVAHQKRQKVEQEEAPAH